MRTHERVFNSNEEYLARILDSIENAQREILIETYIFRKGRMSESIFSKLITAQKRGVKIKLTVDAAGVYGETEELQNDCEAHNFDLKIYNPIFWSDLFINFTFMNRRNHRKMFIFDSKIAFVSSMNITDAHIDKNEKGTCWQDYGISFDGPAVEKLCATFERSRSKVPIKHRLSRFLKDVETNDPKLGLLLNDSLRKRRDWYRQLKENLQRAHSRIWIANPYILPVKQIQREIEAASKRGVDVKLLTSGGSTSDVFFIPWITNLYYKRSIKAGLELYEYRPSFFHAKVLIIDDHVSIGTSNMNHRSVFHDQEVEIEVLDQHNKDFVVKDIKKSIEESKHITESDIKKIPLWQLCLAKVLSLFKYWF